jgi:hypothetical protein
MFTSKTPTPRALNGANTTLSPEAAAPANFIMPLTELEISTRVKALLLT